MARTNNLTNFLTDVSSAIKQKTGDNTPIPASDFDTEILSIETGGNYQSKTLNVTQNGNYNLLPDQEFDALSNVNISVSVSPVLQNKTVTENGSYSADSGYDGLGTVIVNVSGSQINNQNKTVTENGVYTADSGYTGLGTVTVNVPTGEGIQEFSSEQAMKNAGLEAGDKAVVYNSTDKLVGYYEVAQNNNKIYIPLANSYTLSGNNITYDMSTAIELDKQKVYRTLKQLCIDKDWAAQWGSWSTGDLICNVCKIGNDWYAYGMSIDWSSWDPTIQRTRQYINGYMFQDNNFTTFGSDQTASNVFHIEYAKVNFDTETYEYLGSITADNIITYTTKSSTVKRNLLNGPLFTILFSFWLSSYDTDNETLNINFNNIYRTVTEGESIGTSSLSSYTRTNANTDLTPTVIGPQLLDTGLIYGTQDGNITANDVVQNKIAYSKGQKITGLFDGMRVFEDYTTLDNTVNVSENDVVLVYNRDNKNFGGIYRCLYSITDNDYFYPVPVKDLSVENHQTVWNNNIDPQSVYPESVFLEAKEAILEKASEFTTATELSHLSVLSDGSIATLYWESSSGLKRFDAEVCYYAPSDKWYLCSIETTADSYSNPKIIKYNVDTGVVTYSDITITTVTSDNSKVYISPNETKTNMVYLGTGPSSFPIYNSDGTNFYETNILTIIPAYKLWKNIYISDYFTTLDIQNAEVENGVLKEVEENA